METFDYQSQFERIKKDTVSALTRALNVDGRQRQLRATKVWVDDTQDSADWESQRQALRNDKTWGVPVYASLELVDKPSGKVISQSQKLKVATLPKGTDLGSFVIGGKHYQVHNQLRRKPGVYVTEKVNHELKTDINIAGRPFGIELDPKVGVFYLTKGQGRQPLYPLISRMGVSDSSLAKAWGTDLLDTNKLFQKNRQATTVKKIAKFFIGQEYDSPDVAAKDTQEYLYGSRLAPEVTKRTLGDPHDRVTPEVLVRGAQELLRATKGERQQDDRQSIEYKKILSVADFIKERMIEEDGTFSRPLLEFRKKIASRLNSRSAPPSQVGRVVSSNEFTPLFDTFFTQTDLSHTPEQTNPLHILNGLAKVTIAGEGGVQSEHGIKDEERMVHPSHLGFLDPIHTPESQSIGVVTTLPVGVVKGAHNELRTRIYEPKTKTYKHLSPSEIRDRVFAFPDQFKDGKFVAKKVKAYVNGDIVLVDQDDVDAVLPSAKQAFSISSNSIPFLPSAQGVRGLMATKMLEQAIPLSHREAPLVQVGLSKGMTVEQHIGEGFSVRSKVAGVVDKITPTRIHVRTKGGEVVEQPIYNNLALNHKSFLHATPRVEVGAQVAAGDLLADSNFTDGGRLALGTNLRAAYIPYKGYNFEDGIVLTESAARKLTSEHMYQFAEDISKGTDLSVDQYVAWKPNEITMAQRDKLDGGGIVRKGQVLQKGDPIWVGVRDNKTDPDSIVMSKLTRIPPKRAFKEVWDNDVDGEVVDVVKMAGKIKIYVKAKEAAQIGDKLSNRHGGKGIITKIIPDGEAPHDAAGKPVDILLNPHGIVTRMNPSQMLETAAAKIAEKTGKPYVVENFDGENYETRVREELTKNGLTDLETLYDPHTNKPLGAGVLVGPQYIVKLTKQATAQFSARSDGKYDVNRAPLKGGDEGGKAVDLLTMYSMLAHGARLNLREMATYKATKNDQLWHWLQAGPALNLVKPLPEPTFAYKKFEAYLKGAGVDIHRTGSKMVISPMTDKEVDKLSSGAFKEPLFVRAKDLQKIKGGLMDPVIFGRDGEQWGHMDLAEPMPNPMFEEPIKRLAGLSTAQFTGLVRGQLFVDPASGEWNSEHRGVTGGVAVKHLLSKVDVDAQITNWTDKAKTATTAPKLDVANKQLKYLLALKKLHLRPEDAYVQTKLPILPPQFRPVSQLADGSLSVQGINHLYRDLGLINSELKWQHGVAYIPEALKGDLRQNLYDGARALYGIGDPIAFYPESRRPKGFIEQISGQKAKTGFFQQEVLRRKQNLVGRGTIIPEPKLGVDEVGIPEEMAWNIFKPFVVRQLVTMGRDPNTAIDEYDSRTPAARSALDLVMTDRPVLLNRAPSLHKFSILAFNPKIVDGHAIKIPPLVVKGFNADFDGDAMTVHVPLLPDAVEEAKKMYPSRNLYNPGTGGVVIQPANEAALGLYFMSQDAKGRSKISGALPESLQAKYSTTVLGKDGLKGLLTDIAKTEPKGFGRVVDRLKEMGDTHAYEVGFTVGLNDLIAPPEKDKVMRAANAEVHKIFGEGKFTDERKQRAIKVIQQADADVQKVLAGPDMAGNNFFQMVESGARGNMSQLKQVMAGPVVTDDHHGNVIPLPVMSSFAQGLPFSEYWQTVYGARRVTIDKQLQTQNPGAFTKDILATSSNNLISKSDCKTSRGITLSMQDNGRDIEDRFIAHDVKVGDSVVARSGDLVTSNLLNLLRERKVKTLDVRSPLTCSAPKGTCAKCYGLHENGQLPSIGENVGVISGQALSEPLTQMTLRTFHSGGASGSRGVISGYDKIDKMFKLPKILPGKATLAEADGKVSRVDSAPGGVGFNVEIDGRKHFVPKDLHDPARVRVGSHVEKGSALSLGIINPRELSDLKGMLPAQSYVTDQIQGAYREQGVRLKRRAIETVIRSVGNTTRVLHPGGSSFLPGDVAPWTVIEDFNDQVLGKKAVNDAIGHVLKEEIGQHKHGTLITEEVAKMLTRLGKHDVQVGHKPVMHKPFLNGIKRIPLLRDDWMAQLGYEHLKGSIVTGAAQARESDIHGYSPIPAFAYGAEFGEGTDGAY